MLLCTKYTPIAETATWLPKEKIDRTRPVEKLNGCRMYPLVNTATGALAGYVPSNTAILDTPMDQVAKVRWAKKLGNGDIPAGMVKAKWVSDYAKYTGTMMHRSLERIIKLSGNSEERYKELQRHALGRLLPDGANILGCELQLLGDGFATTLDLVYELDGEVVIAELKTLHRVSSDSDEEMLDCQQDRTLQGSKAGKYRKQMAAQAYALAYSYGIVASRAEVFLFNTVTYMPEVAVKMDAKMLASRYRMFEKVKAKKLAELLAHEGMPITQKTDEILAAFDYDLIDTEGAF